MTPEGRVKLQIKRALAEAGAYWHMPVQNGMGAPTLDFICCLGGYYFAIEAKAPGKHPTVRQATTMNQMAAAGAMIFVIRDDAGLQDLRAWMSEINGLYDADR